MLRLGQANDPAMRFDNNDGLFLLAALLIVGSLAWCVADRPVDTGERFDAQVLHCEPRGRGGNLWCMVRDQKAGVRVRAFLPDGRAGQTVAIAVLRHRLSGAFEYELDLPSHP